MKIFFKLSVLFCALSVASIASADIAPPPTSVTHSFNAEVRNGMIYMDFDSSPGGLFTIYIDCTSSDYLEFKTGYGKSVSCTGGEHPTRNEIDSFKDRGELKLIPENLVGNATINLRARFTDGGGGGNNINRTVTLQSSSSSIVNQNEEDCTAEVDCIIESNKNSVSNRIIVNNNVATNTRTISTTNENPASIRNMTSQQKLDFVGEKFGKNSEIYQLIQLLVILGII